MSEKGIAVRSLDDVERLARIAVGSGYTSCRKAEEAAMLIITGHELGLSPAQSLRGIYVVSGKPVLSADLMVAVVRRSGLCESWRTVESTAERCTITTRRRGESVDATRTWTMADAKRAQITGKPIWTAYPATMLRHRCAADLAREVYPDVLMGLYDPEELGAEPEVEAERIEVQQPKALPAIASLGIEVQPPAANPAPVEPARDLVAEVRDSAAVRHTVRELADLWRSSRDELKAASKLRPAWDVISTRALELKLSPAAVKAEVARLDDGPGPKGGTPRPEAPAHTDATGTGQDVAPAAAAVALVPTWCSDVESMEQHIEGYSHAVAVERCARKHRAALPKAARELLALRLQRLSWDPHDGEITLESARELVSRWIAQGPIERVRPEARAKIAARRAVG
jgi:hypothetical protein